MPLALLLALAGSLLLHLTLLFGPELHLPGLQPDAPQLLQAELRPLPTAAGLPSPPPPLRERPAKRKRTQAPVLAVPQTPVETLPVEPENPLPLPERAEDRPAPLPEPVKPMLASNGVIRFAIYKESLGLQIGRAEQRWSFTEDGRYHLSSMTETSGLAALLKPVRIENESRGRLVAGGLQPEHYRAWKNGEDSRENADFDWATTTLRLLRDQSEHALAPGSQDVLSLNYQLAYLGQLADGAQIGVTTGRKYERYALDALGEEDLETPLGVLRTLHLRATTESVTEIWIALDRQRLPVKIRFTDKKGDSYYQIVTEIGQEQIAQP